ncbi:hypothetical protein DM02DRAFT_652828 [Periconia macrospinosa]|uniref:Secreted protein n=1 Tax=Periconia macrospinosa TaxID=97972 RepID=A0A2V1DZ84_9PLEO|nr:hypothetical protein DM02DRAFT_652828 [Periconia macrospinosa]
MKLLVAITSLAAFVAATPIELERRGDDKPNPNEVYVESLTWAGSGCPPGSAVYDLGEGATVVSISFSKYVAATGKEQKAEDARKNCNVRMKMHYPQGWTYTVATSDFRGYAQVPKGCRAKLGAQFWFSGRSETATCSIPFNTPCEENYFKTTSVATESLVWATCGVTGPLFNINSDAAVDCKENAILGVDTLDTNFIMKFHLSWKKCPKD